MKNNEKAFTLIEVVASIVIITIVLLGIAALVIQSSTVAHSNNEKLVVIHLANATLEKIKTNSTIVKEAIEAAPSPTSDRIEVPLTNLQLDDVTTIEINNTPYTIAKLNDQFYQLNAYKIPCTENASKLNLVNVLVEVKHIRIETTSDGTPHSITNLLEKSQLEGFVQI